MRTMLELYIGGSSSTLERSKKWTRMMQDLERVRVTSTWISHIERVGAANPVHITHAERYACAYSDLNELSQSKWLWLLMPEPPTISAGAFLEFGFALGNNISVCISGPGQEASIFTALADLNFKTDEEAFDFFYTIS